MKTISKILFAIGKAIIRTTSAYHNTLKDENEIAIIKEYGNNAKRS